MASPGAPTFGLMPPSHGDGPRPPKNGTSSKMSVAPTAKDSAYAAGLDTLPGKGPLLPAAKLGKMSAARKARTAARKSVRQPASANPHDMLTTSGAFAGSAPGAKNHWKISWKGEAR